MGIFHERNESDGKVVVRFKNMVPYFAALAVTAMVAAASVILGGALLLSVPLLAIILALNYLDLRNVRREIRSAMERGGVKISGNRFSSDNPLTVEFRKA